MTTADHESTGDLPSANVVQAWLKAFGKALAKGDSGTVADLFHEDGYWRDQLAFTWNLRTFRGKQAIAVALLKALSNTLPTGFRIEPDKPLIYGHSSLDRHQVQAFFVFETAVARGRGVVRLHPDAEGSWKAWTVLTAMDELKGFEEPRGPRRPLGNYSGSTNWLDRRMKAVAYEDREPQVLVIGAGQAGLCIAARLGQIGVDTLVVERNARVGDNWRKRYHMLVLHDPIWYDPMPYLPFPDHFPVFLPKDQLASFLEYYAEALELNVWTSTELVAAEYEPKVGSWNAKVRCENGSERVFRPRHVILATGMASVPFIPEIEGAKEFRGTLLHSSAYTGGQDWGGKRAIVIGAGTSGHDIAHDFYKHGAYATLVQRSSTYVLNSATFTRMIFGGSYEEAGPKIEDSDLLSAAAPNHLSAVQSRALTRKIAEADAELLAGLKAAGFRLNSGVDGGGIGSLYLQRGGGYYINVGASELIAEGKIGLKSDAEVACFTEGGVTFSDGNELNADIVVLATGYQNMRESARRLLGESVASQVEDVWGLDDEGEIRTMWRPSGHPGFWFMGGNFQQCRYYSKFLAFEIKAIEEGFYRG